MFVEKAITGIEGFLNVVFYYVNGGFHAGNNSIVCYVITDQFCSLALFPQLDRQSSGTIMDSLINVISATLVSIVL